MASKLWLCLFMVFIISTGVNAKRGLKGLIDVEKAQKLKDAIKHEVAVESQGLANFMSTTGQALKCINRFVSVDIMKSVNSVISVMNQCVKGQDENAQKHTYIEKIQQFREKSSNLPNKHLVNALCDLLENPTLNDIVEGAGVVIQTIPVVGTFTLCMGDGLIDVLLVGVSDVLNLGYCISKPQ